MAARLKRTKNSKPKRLNSNERTTIYKVMSLVLGRFHPLSDHLTSVALNALGMQQMPKHFVNCHHRLPNSQTKLQSPPNVSFTSHGLLAQTQLANKQKFTSKRHDNSGNATFNKELETLNLNRCKWDEREIYPIGQPSQRTPKKKTCA